MNMNADLARWSRLMMGAAIAVSIAALVGCGGSGSPAFDPKKADALAHTALITTDELPGKGWYVTATDDFEEDQKLSDTANTSACKAVDGKTPEMDRVSTKNREGRAKVTLEQEAGADDIFPISIDESISIFSSNSAPSEAMKLFREVVSGRDFRTCMSDMMKAAVGSDSGVEVKLVDAKASRPAPEGGLATAFRIDISAQGEKASMQFEIYIWRFENAGVSLQFTGPSDKVDAKLVGAVLDAATKALKTTATE